MQKVKLKEVCTLINGRAYKQEELLDSGKYPVLRVGNFFSDKDYYYSDLELEEDKYCDSGDLLFAWSASFGPKIWNGGKVIYHYHIWKMVLEDTINKEYLYYYLFYLSERIKAEGHGGIMIHTTKAEMEERELSLPDMSKQCEIAKVLNQLSSIIEKRQTEIKELDNLIKARFVELFGDPINNPKGYPVHHLSEYITSLTSGSRGWAQYCVDDGEEWFITIKNVKDCHITTDNMQSVNAPDNAEAKRTKVQEGDLLISITADLGRTGVVTKEIAEHGAYINQHLSCIRLNRDVVNPLYVAHYMESPAGKEQFTAKNQSAVKAGLNFNSINSLKLMVPTLDEQNGFIAFIEQVDKSKVVIQKSLNETQRLFDSLMQEYFG
ncbi:restriction endonuclease subunit S [Butyrivibrio sp.]|uniref:restriction endonuclease subunit S n=1 Tax=Butyrivibrio sp. TaxID=28121 RepID=UPI0025C3E49F|nr:restriction endonuclease subunit S [Butyrivibrio sp.]MBQ9304498.1 restriction endonuclease subunit S [Butyrivibrio sp.]